MRVPALKQERIGCCGDGGATGSGRDERSMSPPPPRERTHTTPAFAPHSSSACSHRTPMAISETSSVQRSSLPRVMRRRVGVGVGWRARRSSTLAHPHNPVPSYPTSSEQTTLQIVLSDFHALQISRT